MYCSTLIKIYSYLNYSCKGYRNYSFLCFLRSFIYLFTFFGIRKRGLPPNQGIREIQGNRIINARQLQKFDFTKKENFLPLKLLTIGFAAERNIMELRIKDVLAQDVINRFMKDCRLIIIGILEKIFERSLNRSSFLEATGCISPESVLLKQKADLLQHMKSVLHLILSCLHITSNECDQAFTQFSKLLEESSPTLLPAFKKFHAGNRLDKFYFETIKVGVDNKALSKVLILIFTLGQGQASIERGFSINSNMLSENMKEKLLISRRTIKDFMVSNKLKAHEVEINNEMIKAVRSASLKYKSYIEENRMFQAKEKEISVMMLLDQEISGLKEKKKVLSEVCKTYNEEFVTFMKEAGKQIDMSQMKLLLTKGNDRKRKCEEHETEIKKFEEALVTLYKKKKEVNNK